MNHWRQILRQDLQFNTTFWKTIYPKLATNKQGDVNWKIAHRILPSALSLHHATVYNTPHCPHCQTIENIEHLFIHCQFTQTLWTSIQNYINKMIHNTLRLTDNIKLFGLTQHNTIIHDTDTLNLLKNSSHKQYLLTIRDRFGLWNYRYFGRRKRKGSWLSQKTFGVLGTRSTRTIIYGKGRIGWTRNWIRSRWIRMV